MCAEKLDRLSCDTNHTPLTSAEQFALETKLVVRRKKGSRSESDKKYEIISDPSDLKRAQKENIPALDCKVTKIDDKEAKIQLLKSKIGSRKLPIVPAILCYDEIKRLGGTITVPQLLSSVCINKSPSTYRRAKENINWMIEQIKSRKIEGISPNDSDIALISNIFEMQDDPVRVKLIDPDICESVFGFRQIYLGNNKRMRINTFHTNYYRKSDMAKENQRIYAKENALMTTNAKKILIQLWESGEKAEKLSLKMGQESFTNIGAEWLRTDEEKVKALKKLHKNLETMLKKAKLPTEKSEQQLITLSYE